MKESLAYQILSSMMASEDDWLAQSPIPSSQPPQQLEVDVLDGQLDTDERLPIFYNSNSDLETASLLDLELAEVAPAVTLEVTSQLEEPCASTSAWDMQYSAQEQQQQQQDPLEAAVFFPELEASLDLESSCTGSDVFERSRSTSCSSSSLGQGDVKEELKHRIRCKRMASGQGEIAVEFTPPEPEKLTEEEEKLRLERKEKNRLAAQKCRNKKRERAEVLEHDIEKLKTRRQQLEDMVEQLRDEKDKLEQIIDVHGSVCPKMRRLSKH